jgi:hypothetical protein
VKVFLYDFKDIFSKELNELPPPREVDQAIDLVADIVPIATVPYRHSLAHNVEFENQLKDLLNKDYIRPSKSPWGAHVLFTKKKDGSINEIICRLSWSQQTNYKEKNFLCLVLMIFLIIYMDQRYFLNFF